MICFLSVYFLCSFFAIFVSFLSLKYVEFFLKKKNRYHIYCMHFLLLNFNYFFSMYRFIGSGALSFFFLKQNKTGGWVFMVAGLARTLFAPLVRCRFGRSPTRLARGRHQCVRPTLLSHSRTLNRGVRQVCLCMYIFFYIYLII